MSVPFYGQPWDGEQIPEQWGCYFAGLVDGEGCFYIGPKVCSFTIKLRDDDRALIERLHSLFRIGTITTEKSSRVADRNRKPQARWTIQKKKECLWLTEFFDVYKLQSKKARDYAIWRNAVIAWSCGSTDFTNHQIVLRKT